MTAPRRIVAALILALPCAATAQDQRLPSVQYGAPLPQVLYGAPSPEPEQRRAPAPQAARPLPPPAAPQGSLTYQSGPTYIPPQAYWGAPPHWDRAPPAWRRPGPPQDTAPYVSPRNGYFERPLPEGSYVGRPPSAPPPPTYGRPRGW
ncbi:hypothetical protein [Neoroseomonas rubea]|uniref:hypothetical protein n=1 Tax=Neoroseomonas rubea TaxID=2748666 RepID=UPI0018DF8E07|nr:hypothetical protein [Roseomonas rubea]